MKFSKIYQDSKQAVNDALTSMWCASSHNPSQKSYASQLKKHIDEAFAPEYAMPIVQCMSTYRTIEHSKLQDAQSLISFLWNKTYDPYEHQYKAWKALKSYTSNNKKKSIVVTTGTGSGKTECFMLPLISDLIQQTQTHQIEAIFLYPLNALMEDQKSRLNEYLQGTNLTFAVYNGNTPDSDNTNVTISNQVQEERTKYNKIIATRSEIRSGNTRPNILLTNPTMLEYMLLRDKDQCLFTKESLKWIVIDETHTYSGAGAAELAMLIRRVMLAFGVDPSNVRFATSSATIGNGDEDPTDDVRQLKEFIAGISGQDLDQIEVITGTRKDSSKSLGDENADKCKNILFKKEYVPLDDAIPGEDLTIEQRLAILDNYCDLGLKAKVHFFNRVLTSGLKVRLNENNNGSFIVHSTTPQVTGTEEPYLELMRCNYCGEYIAVGEYDDSDDDIFRATTITDDDIFDFSDHYSSKKVVFGLRDHDLPTDDDSGNTFVDIQGNKMQEAPFVKGRWNIVRNVQCCCPNCSHKLGKGDADDIESLNEKTVMSFRVSSDFISRTIAPVLVNSLETPKKPKNFQGDDAAWADTVSRLPHRGQQYISFVDSRQAAARATLKQNLEEERLWVYSRIFHELSRRQKLVNENKELLNKRDKLNHEIKVAESNEDWITYGKKRKELDNINTQISLISLPDHLYMDWDEIFNLLKETYSSECDRFCFQFARKSGNSTEVDNNGNIKEELKIKYVHSVMVELLGRRPRSAKSPENLGLFTSYYPAIDSQVVDLPLAVKQDFNNAVTAAGGDPIELKDWKNLLSIFMDYNMRANMSVFLNIPNFPNWSIKKDFQRFQTQKIPTKPIQKPTVGTSSGNVVKLLARLLGSDFKMVLNSNTPLLQQVIDELINNLIQIGLIEKEDPNNSDSNLRLNLYKLAFKLYDNFALCDTSRYASKPESLMPIETLFKGYSPYLKSEKVVKPKTSSVSVPVFEYLYGRDEAGNPITREQLEKWAETNRQLLWDNNIWGKEGIFSDRLNSVYLFPELFFQAEHTAQVDKLIAKQSQEMFKNKELNILACSTTMEMGIDLGDLELVVLCSIPPHPANYKQRAGRSGRDLECNRSACITLCNSDSIGFRTMRNPIDQLIGRPTAIPFVDLQSRQVVQRHVNSYLLRSSGTINGDGYHNNLDKMVIDFFTHFKFMPDVRFDGLNYDDIRDTNTNQSVYPNDVLGNQAGTKYDMFIDWINQSRYSQNDINKLIEGTCFDGKITEVKDQTIVDIDRCYKELKEKTSSIALGFSTSFSIIKQALQAIDPNIKDVDVFSYINDVGRSNKNSEARYARALKHKYSEILSKGLIQYLATNRFTPNANMPVNIIEFDVSFNTSRGGKWQMNTSSNPSYVLQEAISQYTPGNTIILSNRAKVVRGIAYTGQYDKNKTFKKVYTDGDVVSFDSSLPNAKIWSGISNKDYIELIQPYAFLPDVNENESRKIDSNVYTRVDAQLIGATNWNTQDPNSLISFRTSKDTGDSQILYYNVGIGYGFCVCKKCGKTVVETSPYAGDNKPIEVPNGMNNDVFDADKDIYSHRNISKVDKLCCTSEDQDKDRGLLRRNVILGDTIQTDYCEIKIRQSASSDWINREQRGLLRTLAIVFTRTLAEYLGIEHRDIGFTLLPNGHICIYDTNPGGSGYSNRFSEAQVVNTIISNSLKLVSKVKTKEDILDKFTLRYSDEIDIEAAKSWLEKQDAVGVIPKEVKQSYPDAVKSDFTGLIRACLNSGSTPVLFVNNNWTKYVYQDRETNVDWDSRISQIKSIRPTLIITGHQNESVPLPVINMLKQAKDWVFMVQSHENVCKSHLLYPLAYIEGHLYFTLNESKTNLSGDWGIGDIYCSTIQLNLSSAKAFDLDSQIPQSNVAKFTLSEMEESEIHIKSSQIAEKVEAHSKNLIDRFLIAVKQAPSNQILEISYQDEHLKNGLAMVAAFQFIDYFLKKIDRECSVKFYVEDYSSVNNYRYPSFYKELNQNDRDDILFDLFEEWKDNKELTTHRCVDDEIIFNNAKVLPHWRVLTFKCGNNTLEIYPNGGIINEWYYDEQRQRRFGKNISFDSLSVKDIIYLERRNIIMYDVVINV